MSAAERELTVGVIGVGHLGRHHARLYAAMPGVRLVGVADRDAARAEEVARAHGCRATTDAEDLLGEIDAASLAVPTEAHAALALRLIEAGVDVLVEKPIARTLDEADAMVAAAERAGRLLMVGHTERFNPAVAALAREVREPRFFEVHRLSPFSARSTDIDVVLDLMIHDLDLLLYLDGTAVASIDAVGMSVLTDRTDIANARIRMTSGAVANLTASRISAEPVRRVRVFQRRTYLACDTVARTAERYTVVSGEEGRPAIRHETLAVASGEPLGLELAAFVDAARRRIAPPVEGRHGRQALALALAVREAVEAGARGG